MSYRSNTVQLSSSNDTFEVRRVQKVVARPQTRPRPSRANPKWHFLYRKIQSGIKVSLWILRCKKYHFGRVEHFGGGTTFFGKSDFKRIVRSAQLTVFRSLGHFFWCHRPGKHAGTIIFAPSLRIRRLRKKHGGVFFCYRLHHLLV